MNSKLYQTLDFKYFVRKIIKKYLNDRSQLIELFCDYLSKYIAYNLKREYGIETIDYSKIKSCFVDKNEKKKLTNRYETLKRNS